MHAWYTNKILKNTSSDLDINHESYICLSHILTRLWLYCVVMNDIHSYCRVTMSNENTRVVMMPTLSSRPSVTTKLASWQRSVFSAMHERGRHPVGSFAIFKFVFSEITPYHLITVSPMNEAYGLSTLPSGLYIIADTISRFPLKLSVW